MRWPRSCDSGYNLGVQKNKRYKRNKILGLGEVKNNPLYSTPIYFTSLYLTSFILYSFLQFVSFVPPVHLCQKFRYKTAAPARWGRRWMFIKGAGFYLNYQIFPMGYQSSVWVTSMTSGASWRGTTGRSKASSMSSLPPTTMRS